MDSWMGVWLWELVKIFYYIHYFCQIILESKLFSCYRYPPVIKRNQNLHGFFYSQIEWILGWISRTQCFLIVFQSPVFLCSFCPVWISLLQRHRHLVKRLMTFITFVSLLSNINPFMSHSFDLWVRALACTLFLCGFSKIYILMSSELWGLGKGPATYIYIISLHYPVSVVA